MQLLTSMRQTSMKNANKRTLQLTLSSGLAAGSSGLAAGKAKRQAMRPAWLLTVLAFRYGQWQTPMKCIKEQGTLLTATMALLKQASTTDATAAAVTKPTPCERHNRQRHSRGHTVDGGALVHNTALLTASMFVMRREQPQ